MPTKIRLQRKGKKGQPFYHLVVADGRAPRDGRFIERLGTYNPMTHPATITIDFEKTLHWVQVGAQPTDTVRSLLSKQGVMLKHHLLIGVTKGAMTEEQAEEKFQDWLKEKEQKLEQAKKDAQLSEKELSKKKLEEERKINEARAAEIAKKRAKENLKAEEAKAQIEDQAEEPAGAVDNAAEAKEEVAEIAEAKTEEKSEEKTEAKTEEKTEEKSEDKTEEKSE